MRRLLATVRKWCAKLRHGWVMDQIKRDDEQLEKWWEQNVHKHWLAKL